MWIRVRVWVERKWILIEEPLFQGRSRLDREEPLPVGDTVNGVLCPFTPFGVEDRVGRGRAAPQGAFEDFLWRHCRVQGSFVERGGIDSGLHRRGGAEFENRERRQAGHGNGGKGEAMEAQGHGGGRFNFPSSCSFG